MRVELTGHHIEISPGLRQLVDRKLAKVLRVLNDDAVSASVVLTREKVNNVVELTLHARGEAYLHAVGKADSWETAMTDAIAKVMHQTEKVKGKRQERKRRGEAARSVKTPRAARRAASRVAAPVTGGEPTSERPPRGEKRTPRARKGVSVSEKPAADASRATARKRR